MCLREVEESFRTRKTAAKDARYGESLELLAPTMLTPIYADALDAAATNSIFLQAMTLKM